MTTPPWWLSPSDLRRPQAQRIVEFMNGQHDPAYEQERADDLIVAGDAELEGRLDVAQQLRAKHRPALFIGLYRHDPLSGDQSTNELGFEGYQRLELVPPFGACDLTFPACTGRREPEVARYFGIGFERSGPGELLITGEVTPNVSISNGVTALLKLGGLTDG